MSRQLRTIVGLSCYDALVRCVAAVAAATSAFLSCATMRSDASSTLMAACSRFTSRAKASRSSFNLLS